MQKANTAYNDACGLVNELQDNSAKKGGGWKEKGGTKQSEGGGAFEYLTQDQTGLGEDI